MSRITFFGDVSLLTPSMENQYQISGCYVFNLEYVITSNTEFPKKNKVNLFGSRIDFATIFHKRPLAVALANNHIMDFGEKGFTDTLTFLDDEDILYFGAGTPANNYNNPTIAFVGNSSVALIAYSLFDEHEKGYGVSYFDELKAKQDFVLAKKQLVNTIIVNIHWGEGR